MARRAPLVSVRFGDARRRVLLAVEMLAFLRARPTVRFAPTGPVLLLSPHLDDAVLNCWSVLTSGADLRVVNVFAGAPRPGFVSEWDRACGARESADQVRARIAEDSAVLGALGHRPTNLPFLDIQYGLRRLSMRALDRAVAEAVPRASLAYAPAALGEGHVDHHLVRSYARALARRGMPVRLYADVPYAVRSGWPAWVREARAAGTAEVGGSALRPVREVTGVEVVTLDPDAAAAKLRAMREYRSQFAALDEGGRLSDPATHRHEVFWSVGPVSERAQSADDRPISAQGR
jgi:LmbE family N-acetylglucosaminyl deacetylase